MKNGTEKQIYDTVIVQHIQSAWMFMGKIQNPVTQETSVDLFAASLQIDILDMIRSRMDASLTDDEKKELDEQLSSLKMNYMQSEKAEESKPAEEASTDSKEETKEEIKEESEK